MRETLLCAISICLGAATFGMACVFWGTLRNYWKQR